MTNKTHYNTQPHFHIIDNTIITDICYSILTKLDIFNKIIQNKKMFDEFINDNHLGQIHMDKSTRITLQKIHKKKNKNSYKKICQIIFTTEKIKCHLIFQSNSMNIC